MRPRDSFLVAALSVNIVNLCSSPSSYCSGSLLKIQAEILPLSQTDWSEIFPRLYDGFVYALWQVKPNGFGFDFHQFFYFY